MEKIHKDLEMQNNLPFKIEVPENYSDKEIDYLSSLITEARINRQGLSTELQIFENWLTAHPERRINK
jgi:hypothetical protein